MGLTAAVTPVIYVAIGGRKSLTAAVIATMLLLKLSQSLASSAPEYALVVFGALALLAVLFVPEGFVLALLQALDRWIFRGRRQPRQATVTEPSPAHPRRVS
jgi:branched-chain amino acid transport system permease protein